MGIPFINAVILKYVDGLSNQDMQAQKISAITILTALCIATNYLLLGVHQLKVMDFIVFVGGFILGPLAGASIGVFSWLIYGSINPYGFVPRVWVATMFSEMIYGLIGGFLGKKFALTDFNGARIRLSIFFGTIGFISTLLYDLITNVVYASVFGVSTTVAIIVGTPFLILHGVGNAAVFGVSTVPVITLIEKLFGGKRVSIFKE